jgi:hypothetical protein
MKGMSIKSEARRLRKRSKRDFPKFKSAVDGGPRRITIEAWPTIEALFDPQWGKSVAELLAVTYDSAHGGRRHECFCCCQPWSTARAPFLFLAVTFLKTDHALGCGVCAECAFSDYEARVLAAVKRDLGGLDDVRHVAAPGHG